MPPIDHITGAIVDAAIAIHRELGPGLLESAYEEILSHELNDRGFAVDRQLMLPLRYRGREITFAYRVDLLVNQSVVVELKCTEKHAPIHSRQLLTYLRLMNLRHGLLLNFGMYRMIDGVHRILNGFAAESDMCSAQEQHAQSAQRNEEH